MSSKNLITYICVTMIFLSSFRSVYAETISTPEAPPYTLPSSSDDEKSEKNKDSTNDGNVEQTLNLTAESAVEYGLEHSKDIQILENKIQIAIIATQNANSNSKDLKDAKESLQDASNEIFDKRKLLNSKQEQLDKAKAALDMGIAPSSIEYTDPTGNPITISAGSNIKDKLVKCGYSSAEAEYISGKISEKVEAGLKSSQGTIDQSNVALNEAQTTLELKKEEFNSVLKDTSETLNTKIDFGSIIKLDANDASELMVTMAGVNLNVTRYAKGIYRNQIAMLIQKNYYDALYAEKIFELKKIAKERGEKQYNMVKLSYENGMKAKDDFLLSKMYYDSTVISCRLAEANYKNAIFELKKNMNLDMNTEITLEDSMLKDTTEESLEDGLKTGLTNRIEIQQTLGQLMIYQLNEKILNSRAEYRSDTKGRKEAKLLREGAELQLDKTKTIVTYEINQSYETMVAVGEMLEASNELIKNAEEVESIAKLKYEQGFGAENSLLKQMNLEESSGTIVELIAAQEKLSEVESQVAQIRYNYTMAKIKYYNDAGILIY
ncbi:outer membrane protein TolC [Sedimentibacter acidaminivorans]|uniref:Outer membrane protein TolC n=1 Tax=Sedimentibacter acidaminivorans TaxID=913099 RepID=A0ABS4GGZ3_9FIRM|nr:TolC family protein [Sedimentibacter acidaminivorans]MBP1926934.1 outer membrane protein TolC [Sedimentibacter acidaminivorans]